MFELMTQGILICFVSRRVRAKQNKQIIDVEGLEGSNQLEASLSSDFPVFLSFRFCCIFRITQNKPFEVNLFRSDGANTREKSKTSKTTSTAPL